MAKNTHLTLDDRITIEVGLREQKSFSAIAAELGKAPTTISKEVRAYIKLKQAGEYNPCVVRKECKHYGDVCTPASFLTEKCVIPASRPSALRPVLTLGRHNAPS